MKRYWSLFVALFAFPVAANAEVPKDDSYSKGEYIYHLSDCGACHTSRTGAPLAGGLSFPTPFGYIYSSNITPDKENGIGSWSYDDFANAMRKGIAKDGHHLYPAMPYPSYSKITDEDLKALYDYLMHRVKPRTTANRDPDIHWPLTMRWPLSIWNMLYTEGKPFKPRADQNAEWNRGAYLVQGPGHCGSCHTPRGMAVQEKSFDDTDPTYLSGGEIYGWYSPSLRNLKLSKEEIIDLLREGRSKHKAIAGAMDEVVTQSTQYMTTEDLNAIATYLLSFKDQEPSSPTPPASMPQAAKMNGEALYANYCSTCHGMKGEGVDYVIPKLIDNPTVNRQDPSTLIRILLEGGETPPTQKHLPYAMPGYKWLLDDRDIADITNYIRTSWGNNGSLVTPKDIKKVRTYTTTIP